MFFPQHQLRCDSAGLRLNSPTPLFVSLPPPLVSVSACFFREDKDVLWHEINERVLVITRGAECMCSFHIVLPEVLLLVSGEVHQVPQQERLHHGELSMLVPAVIVAVIIKPFTVLSKLKSENMLFFLLLNAFNLSEHHTRYKMFTVSHLH